MAKISEREYRRIRDAVREKILTDHAIRVINESREPGGSETFQTTDDFMNRLSEIEKKGAI